ncbi:MAG TPA: TIGR02147 family protein [Bdellovibrio sp.]|uniref:TIGR02147 family protein n=1 Tax=Bdellovibrio sp. TaxID=28201 RepID=UPI002F22FAD9
MKNVYDFKDYKAYLTFAEEARRGYERGFRSKLAEALGCQSGYISHVLNGNAQLSLEQTLKVAKFLNLKATEQKYLLLLVERARAGTRELQTHFDEELKSLKEQHLNIQSHVGDAKELSAADQAVYYSSWHYVATHVLVSLQGYDDAKTIADALKIPEDIVGQVLLFLIQADIVRESKGTLKPGLTQVHLNRDSSVIRQHHTNWRIAAIQSLMSNNKNDLHYSTVSTLSKADAEKLRGEMIALIERYVETVKPSAEEVMYGFNLDFFSLLK